MGTVNSKVTSVFRVHSISFHWAVRLRWVWEMLRDASFCATSWPRWQALNIGNNQEIPLSFVSGKLLALSSVVILLPALALLLWLLKLWLQHALSGKRQAHTCWLLKNSWLETLMLAKSLLVYLEGGGLNYFDWSWTIFSEVLPETFSNSLDLPGIFLCSHWLVFQFLLLIVSLCSSLLTRLIVIHCTSKSLRVRNVYVYMYSPIGFAGHGRYLQDMTHRHTDTHTEWVNQWMS